MPGLLDLVTTGHLDEVLAASSAAADEGRPYRKDPPMLELDRAAKSRPCSGSTSMSRR